MAANEFIRSEYTRLLNGEDLKDQLDSLKIVTDSAMKLSFDQSQKKFTTRKDNEAFLVFQMTMVKNLSLMSLASGLNYTNSVKQDITLVDFLEPMSIWTIVRSQFEAYCNFHNVYVYQKSNEEQEFVYLLWVIAGLKERQRMVHENTSKEGKTKAKKEAKDLVRLRKELEENEVYQGLESDTKLFLKKGIKRRSYQWYFEDGELRYGAWHQLFKNAGARDILDKSYAMMSMWAHPSYVSVFQFREMYKDNFHSLTTFLALRFSKLILAFFIRDYCEYFPEMKSAFNGLPEMNQLLVNAYNRGFRGDEYRINDIENYV